MQPNQTIRSRILCYFVVAGLASIAQGGDKTSSKTSRTQPDFERDVQPLLVRHCYSCHGPQKQRGGLRLDRQVDASKGGDSGPLFLPGKPADSLLIQRLISKEVRSRMPQGRPALQPSEIQLLSQWIESGANWPVEKRREQSHWAFQVVQRPPVPEVACAGPGPRHPVDRFILAKLREHGLSLSPQADRRTLLRRLKFDLLGLPPTPEEVQAFVADQRADAYERLVDHYLASPQYGERWARHWLDAVRFAESNGFETNQPRPNAYPYRDYVIEAFNQDKPYDAFVREQLAGDTLGADAGTGFLVGGAWDAVKSPEITLTLNQRADELHDMIGTTGATFLGLTTSCARCHSHKFDPISQLDYYHLKAIFAGVQHGERPLQRGNEPERRLEIQRRQVELAKLQAERDRLEPHADPVATQIRRPPVRAQHNSERFQPVQAKYLRFVIFQTNQYEPCLDELEVFTAEPVPVNVALHRAGARVTSSGDYPHAPAIHRLEHLHDGKYGNSHSWISNQVGRGWVQLEFPKLVTIDRVVWARDRQGKFADRLPTRYRIDVSLDGKNWMVVACSEDRAPFQGESSAAAPPILTASERTLWQKQTLQIAALHQQLLELTQGKPAYLGRMGTPETIHRLHRGDVMQPREVVGPGVLSQIGPKQTIPPHATDPQRRAALAQWITDPNHPLTARVMVNRVWQHHFGVGIVDTPSDLGKNGGKPTHPELLDWLAAEFMHNGWSLKHLHRQIVISATYRQSSAGRAEALAKDAQSRLLWRYPRRRLEAEALRDAILFVSGELDLRMGGPGFDLFEPNSNYVKVYTAKKSFGPEEFRRMIYQQKPRMQLDDTFGPFDCPDAGQIAPRRNVSTTPLQALNLLNGPFVVQQVRSFATRVERLAGQNPAMQVKQAFLLAFQRLPGQKELSAGVTLVQIHGLEALCRALFNANEFVFVE